MDDVSDSKTKTGANKPGTGIRPENMSMVETAYEQLLEMINEFQIRPGERINEVAVARQLGISRTPLREALNRLAIEGFLNTQSSRGFFCRKLDPRNTLDLYQMRAILETAAARMAALQASPEDLAKLAQFLLTSAEAEGDTIEAKVAYDEGFHEEIIRLSGNSEILRVMRNLNQRIRPMRWVYLSRRGRTATQAEHQQILAALMARDPDRAATLMEAHITRRQGEIEEAIRHIFGNIYVGGGND